MPKLQSPVAAPGILGLGSGSIETENGGPGPLSVRLCGLWAQGQRDRGAEPVDVRPPIVYILLVQEA